MNNFEEMNGFGESTYADLDELKKALEIGYTQNPNTGIDVLRIQSLDATLRSLTYSAQHLRLWNAIPKSDAYSTIEEYNQLVSYGSEGGGFVSSGALPEEEDSVYSRADQKVKYLGTTRAVHHPSTLVRTIPADLIAAETQAGALWLMGKANFSLYFGDSDAIPLEFNGLVKQIVDGGGNIIDCKGGPILPAMFEQATDVGAQNFGTPNRLFSNSKVFSDFSIQFYGQQRFSGLNQPAGTGGTVLTGWNTQAGVMSFESDMFVKRGAAPAATATNPKSPFAPTIALGAPGANTGSQFAAADAGNYKWQVTAVNQYGESAPSAISGAVALAAGDGVVLTITDGGGTYQATGYKIYRTAKGAAVAEYTHKKVARAKTNGAYINTTTYLDLNEWRPGCYVGLALEMSDQSLTFRQLAPMLKMNLAVIRPAYRWMQLLYGTPIVYGPKRNVLFKNIGPAS
jgi:hypothetical protein